MVLPCFVDAHTHLDKAFTAERLEAVAPGLLGGIAASVTDRRNWTAQDLRARAARGLDWATRAGTIHLRTHLDWPHPAEVPLSWKVLGQLRDEWTDKVEIERVSLTNLARFQRVEVAKLLARHVAASGSGAVLGAFVHTSNWSADALRNLLVAAQEFDLDVDLHVDEELDRSARGVATTARILKEIGFERRVACSHACALSVLPETDSLRILDDVAQVPITFICLPAANLMLQDATTGRTPRLRGITLVKEARVRKIPVLFATDSVQDAFCRFGSFDPVETMIIAAASLQLAEPFDEWSQSLCRRDWLQQPSRSETSLLVGQTSDLILFTQANSVGWPSRATSRVVLRNGCVAFGVPPTSWIERPKVPL